MFFSVLIAHYNNARFLAECLQSVFAQTYRQWEVILVDDSSTDGFEQVIKYFENDSRIRVIRNEKNMGCAFTKRRCAENAMGTIAGFLDPDDTLHPEALEMMIKAHQEKSACSLVYSTHNICDENLAVIKEAGYQQQLSPDTPYLLLNDGSIHHFATFKVACYNRTKGITAFRQYNKAIDQDLYYLLEETGDVFYIDKPLYNYRIHAGGISTLANKSSASLAHYAIIEEACLRRITSHRISNNSDAGYWIKKYKTRYHKIHIINSFRHRNWIACIKSLSIYPFIGGMENIVNYMKKLPKEGFSLLRKSFVES